MKKERIKGINFERMLLALSIIAYHYYIDSSSTILSLNTLYIGRIATTSFFVISGAMLFYNHENVHDIADYYRKRFKAIFPAFWIAYFLEYMRVAVNARSILWTDAPKWRFLFSIFGLDGFFHSTFEEHDFYILGEWFLGAIIIIYIVYPFLARLMNKNVYVVSVCVYVIFALYLTIDNAPFPTRIIVCITYFYTGMLIMKFKKQLFDSRQALIVSAVACVLLVIFKTNGSSVFYLIFSAGLLIVLQRIGSVLENLPVIGQAIDFIGGISYEIFLIQHVVIANALLIKNPAELYKSIIYVGMIMILCIIYAKLLNSAAKGVVSMFASKKK